MSAMARNPLPQSPVLITQHFLSIALAADHIHHTESRHDVGDHVTLDHLVKRTHGDKARRADSNAIGPAAAIAHDVKTQLAIPALHGEVGFSRRDMDSLHDDFE